MKKWTSKKSFWLILCFICLLIGILFIVSLGHYDEYLIKYQDAVERIKVYVLSYGSWAFIAYIVLFTLNTISIFPTILPLSLAAGFIFGPFEGTVALTIGTWLGTTATFFLSRIFEKPFYNKFVKHRSQDLYDKINREGFKIVFWIRLIPIFPWEIMNYLPGLTKIKYRDYILATMLGTFPSILIRAVFADRLASLNFKDPLFILVLIAIILLAVSPYFYFKSQKNSHVSL